MKSQVGLGRLYPDGRLDNAHDAHDKLSKESDDRPREETPPPTDLVPVVVHLEKSTLDELLQRSPQL